MKTNTKRNVLLVILALALYAAGGVTGVAVAQSPGTCEEVTVRIDAEPVEVSVIQEPCLCSCECVIPAIEVEVPAPRTPETCPPVRVVPSRHYTGPAIGYSDGLLAGWGYTYSRPAWLVDLDAGVRRYEEPRGYEWNRWTTPGYSEREVENDWFAIASFRVRFR